jgi:outer membrane protein OmpA-like peptidoglycan-associated protein
MNELRGNAMMASQRGSLDWNVRRWRIGAGTALDTLALALGGCTWVSDSMEGTFLEDGWLDPATFWGTEPEPQVLSASTEEGDFPNLSTVPDEAPITTSAELRDEIAEGLVADRGEAEYTDEVLTGQPNVAAAAPPMPADGATLAEAPMPEVMDEPAPAPEVASLPEPTLPADSSPVTVDTTALETAPIVAASAPTMVGGSQPIGLIYFDHASSTLDREARSVLRNVAQIAQSGGTIKIIGHASMRTRTADLTEHKLVNFDVSVARAGRVASELIRLGVSPDSVQIAAASDELPVFYEFMPTGEAGNRRTEIYLLQ